MKWMFVPAIITIAHPHCHNPSNLLGTGLHYRIYLAATFDIIWAILQGIVYTYLPTSDIWSSWNTYKMALK